MIQTNVTAADLLPLLPELVLVGAAFSLLLLDLFVSERQRGIVHALAIASLTIAVNLVIDNLPGRAARERGGR